MASQEYEQKQRLSQAVQQVENLINAQGSPEAQAKLVKELTEHLQKRGEGSQPAQGVSTSQQVENPT
jgi:endonuclease III